jgi:drug/metabolite transporter (DMT)-like permease
MRIGLVLSLAGITGCFAVNSVITRYIVLNGLGSPFLLTVIRFGSGLLVLLALSGFMPKSFQKEKTKKSHLVSALFLGSYAFLISYGYLYISAAAGTLTFYSMTLITMSIISFVQEKEKVIVHQVLGQVLAFFGIVVITFSGIKAVTPIGVILLAATGFSWGLYSIYGRRFTNPFAYTFNSFLIFGIAALALTAIALLTRITPLFIDLSINGLGLALYMGTISTALSYVLWSRELRKIKGYQGGVVQMLIPVVASILGVTLLGEQVTLLLVIGGAMIVTGIYLNAV